MLKENIFIQSEISIHDHFNLEQKVSYFLTPENKNDEFQIENYFFIPKNLGVNSKFLSKDIFYRRLHNYIRFRTPKFSLDYLVSDDDNTPYKRLSNLIDALLKNPTNKKLKRKFDHQLKMFGSIIRTTLRDHMTFIQNKNSTFEDRKILCEKYIKSCELIKKQLTRLWQKIYVPTFPKQMIKSFLWTEEAVIIFINEYCEKIIKTLRPEKNISKEDYNKIETSLLEMISENLEERKEKVKQPLPIDRESKEKYLFRKRVLKKFISSILFLNIRIKKEKRQPEKE